MNDVLPSQQSARGLANGEPGAALQVVLHAGGRAILIGAGMMIAGVPDKHILRGALGATLAIEAFVVGFEIAGKNR